MLHSFFSEDYHTICPFRGPLDTNRPVSVHLDVRPDLTFSGIIDRMRKSYDDFALRALGKDWLSAPQLPAGPLRVATGKEPFTPPKPL